MVNIVMSNPELGLQEQLIALIRAFGLHRPDQTPCGKPVAVAEAHALMELAQMAPLSQNDLATRLQREQIGGHEFLTFGLDSSMLPWEKIREEATSGATRFTPL